MATMYCTLCRRPVEAGRQVGVGTIVVAFLTGGLSLFAIPFYKKRCGICKSPSVSARDPETGLAATVNSGPEYTEMKKRLAFAEEQLEVAETELHRVQTERDFYRQLLGDPARRTAEAGGADRQVRDGETEERPSR